MRIKCYPKNPQNLNPTKQKCYNVTPGFAIPFGANVNQKAILTCHQIILKRREIMKWKQHVQSFLCVWHKRLLSATLDVHNMQENVRQRNLQLVFFRLFHLKGLCRVILG